MNQHSVREKKKKQKLMMEKEFRRFKHPPPQLSEKTFLCWISQDLREWLEQRKPIFKNLEEYVLGTLRGSHSLCLRKYNQIDNNLVTTTVSAGPSARYSYSLLLTFAPSSPTMCQTLAGGWEDNGGQIFAVPATTRFQCSVSVLCARW